MPDDVGFDGRRRSVMLKTKVGWAGDGAGLGGDEAG